MNEGIGAFITERRKLMGLSQRALAKRIGVASGHLSQIESGKVTLPSPDLRRSIAAAIGVRHIDLLIAAGEITPAEAGQEPVEDDDATAAVIEQLRPLLRTVAWTPGRVRFLRAALEQYQDDDRRLAEQAADSPQDSGASAPPGLTQPPSLK